MDIITYQQEILDEKNPLIVATSLSSFVARSLKHGSLTLYEGLILTDTQVSILRQCYLKPAYRQGVSRSILLLLIMLYVTAHYFEQPSLCKKYKSWICEAYQILGEKRAHFTDSLIGLINNENISNLKSALEKIEKGGKDFDNGPFPDEVFPYSLPWLRKKELSENMDISPDVSELAASIEIEFAC